MRTGLGAVSAVAIVAAAIASAEAGQAASACTFFTKDELRPFIRNPVFDVMNPEENRVGNGSACSYAGVILQVDPFPFSVIQSAAAKEKAGYESVAGLGDAAIFHHNTRANAAEIAVRVGQRVFTAQVSIASGEAIDAAKARSIGMARAAVAKLR